MKSTLISIFTLLITLPSIAQETKAAPNFSDRQTITKILGFEVENGGPLPTGWSGQPAGTIFADNEVFHSGQWSARLDRKDDSQGSFSSLTKSLPIDFAGKEIQLRGFLRTENITEFAGLWLREDGDGKTLRFDNMQQRQVRGTTGWTEYAIVLPLDEHAIPNTHTQTALCNSRAECTQATGDRSNRYLRAAFLRLQIAVGNSDVGFAPVSGRGLNHV